MGTDTLGIWKVCGMEPMLTYRKTASRTSDDFETCCVCEYRCMGLQCSRLVEHHLEVRGQSLVFISTFPTVLRQSLSCLWLHTPGGLPPRSRDILPSLPSHLPEHPWDYRSVQMCLALHGSWDPSSGPHSHLFSLYWCFLKRPIQFCV